MVGICVEVLDVEVSIGFVEVTAMLVEDSFCAVKEEILIVKTSEDSCDD